MTVRPAVRSDKSDIASLLHFERYVHRHLDWRTFVDWLERSPFFVFEENRQLVAALACPDDPPEISWIRIFAVAAKKMPEQVWGELWSRSWEIVKTNTAKRTVAAIPLTGWFQSLLRSSGFRQVNEIVVLVWENTEVPGDVSGRDFQIRPMRKDDIKAVSKVDHLAFQIPWQVSCDGLTAGFLQSAVATVAVIDQTIVGYQISTSTIKGGHLARLAVLPDIQNLGIGTALVRDMQRRFYRQGIFVVTVNTQRDNASSLALYKKTGFALTDEVYPVYQYP